MDIISIFHKFIPKPLRYWLCPLEKNVQLDNRQRSIILRRNCVLPSGCERSFFAGDRLFLRHRLKKILFLFSLLPACVSATNGLYDIGWGVKSKGVGGAATAYAQESFSAIANPANLSELGNRLDLNAQYIYHTQSFRFSNVPAILTSFGVINTKYPFNGSRNIVGGAAGFTKRINDELAFGLLLTPQAGGIIKAQKSNPPVPEGVNPIFKGNYIRAFYAALTPCFSYKKCGSCHTLGAGIDFVGAISNFTNFDNLAISVFGPAPIVNGSAHPNHVTGKGWTFTWGVAARIGWLWDVAPNFKFGMSYKSETFMSRMRKYQGLITPQGWYQLPAIFNIGFSWKAFPCVTLAFDISRIYNRDVPALGNKVATFTVDENNVFTNIYPHGANHGAAFHWKNQTVYKVGMTYDLNRHLTFRIGYNHNSNPVPKFAGSSSAFLLPTSALQDHLGGGVTWKCSPCSELTLSYVHGFKNRNRRFSGPPVQPASAEELFQVSTIVVDLIGQSDQVEIQYGLIF